MANVNEPHSAGTEAVTLVGQGQVTRWCLPACGHGSAKPGWGYLDPHARCQREDWLAISTIRLTKIAT